MATVMSADATAPAAGVSDVDAVERSRIQAMSALTKLRDEAFDAEFVGSNFDRPCRSFRT